MLVLSLAAVVGATAPEALLNSGKIEHFVVLYMENRVRARARELLRGRSCAAHSAKAYRYNALGATAVRL